MDSQSRQMSKLLNKHGLSNESMPSLVRQILSRPTLMDQPEFTALLAAINLLYEGEAYYVRYDREGVPPLVISPRYVNVANHAKFPSVRKLCEANVDIDVHSTAK